MVSVKGNPAEATALQSLSSQGAEMSGSLCPHSRFHQIIFAKPLPTHTLFICLHFTLRSTLQAPLCTAISNDDDPTESWTAVKRSRMGYRKAQQDAKRQLGRHQATEAAKRRTERYSFNSSMAIAHPLTIGQYQT